MIFSYRYDQVLLLKSEVPTLSLILIRIVPTIIRNKLGKFGDAGLLLRVYYLEVYFERNVMTYFDRFLGL